MKVHHHYIHGDGKRVTTYTYSNPKIESVEYSELDMSNSEATTVTAIFTVEAANVSDTNSAGESSSRNYIDDIDYSGAANVA